MNEFKLPMEYNWELAHKKIAKTEYYTFDADATNTVEVSTLKGIIEITNVSGLSPVPGVSYATPYTFYINNPKLLLTEANKDNIYIQYSVYYKAGGINDTVIPYLLSTGVSAGVGFTLYNANPTSNLSDTPWVGGQLYVYFELYTK